MVIPRLMERFAHNMQQHNKRYFAVITGEGTGEFHHAVLQELAKMRGIVECFLDFSGEHRGKMILVRLLSRQNINPSLFTGGHP